MAGQARSTAVEPEIVSRKEFAILGIAVRTSNKAEADPELAKIPGLWRRFFENVIPAKLSDKKHAGLIFGVYTNYESDHTGLYDLVACYEAQSLLHVPKDMVGMTVSAGRYMVFHARGQMPEALIKTWGDVWSYFANNGRYQRAYTTDFELYLEEKGADIYIALK